MTDASETPKPDGTPEPAGDPPTPPREPAGDPPPGPAAPPAKGGRADALTKEGDAADKLGDFA